MFHFYHFFCIWRYLYQNNMINITVSLNNWLNFEHAKSSFINFVIVSNESPTQPDIESWYIRSAYQIITPSSIAWITMILCSQPYMTKHQPALVYSCLRHWIIMIYKQATESPPSSCFSFPLILCKRKVTFTSHTHS